MSNDMIFQSFDRISHYPIVHESMECFLKVYHWIKSKNKTIHGTFTKVETLLITIQNSTLPMAASKLKPLDQVLNKQLERFEKFFPVVLDDTDVVLNNTINTVVNPITNSISCLVHKGFKLVSNLSHLTEVNYEELIYNTIESVFNYFIPEIDDTWIVSANCSHTNQKSLKLSKKTFHRLSKITIAEIDRFHKLNVEYLQNIHILVNRIKNEGEALYNEIPPNINLIMEDIFNNSRLLDNSLSTFKITPNNSIAFDLAGSLDFLKKNISKLQIILFESKLDFDNDKFFNKMNFATDQIYSGFDTFSSQLRNFADRKSKSTDEKRTKLSDSFYSIDHDYLSDCTLYESDLE